VLNLPVYTFRIKEKEGRRLIFDALRRKWVALTPEEWVRQNFIRYLIDEKHYPASLISVEHTIRMNQLNLRCDAVIFSKNGEPLVIVECKAPEVKISRQAFDQIVGYNFDLRVNYLMVTNGINHYFCKIDRKSMTYSFLAEITDFKDL
jgi:type I site-specific restriction-modification system R (restriction) subunit